MFSLKKDPSYFLKWAKTYRLMLKLNPPWNKFRRVILLIFIWILQGLRRWKRKLIKRAYRKLSREILLLLLSLLLNINWVLVFFLNAFKKSWVMILAFMKNMVANKSMNSHLILKSICLNMMMFTVQWRIHGIC